MGFRSGKTLLGLLGRIGKNNAKGEFYLTDAVALAAGDRLETRIVTSTGEEVLGVNSRGELAQAESAMQRRLRASAMADGATLIAPETVFLQPRYQDRQGRADRAECGVRRQASAIADGATIRAFCHLERRAHRRWRDRRAVRAAAARREARRGRAYRQFRRDQEGRDRRGRQGQSSHLYRRCDASARGANIGAGTITCNYDGVAKHRTEIGAGAFIGSNSSLVAPVKIGDGAYVGSGSVITKDVAADALALARAPQEERQGWAARVRERLGPRQSQGRRKQRDIARELRPASVPISEARVRRE